MMGSPEGYKKYLQQQPLWQTSQQGWAKKRRDENAAKIKYENELAVRAGKKSLQQAAIDSAAAIGAQGGGLGIAPGSRRAEVIAGELLEARQDARRTEADELALEKARLEVLAARERLRGKS